MSTRTFAEALTEVSAIAHAKLPDTVHARLEMATALVTHGAVFAEEDGQHAMVRSRKRPGHWWAVNASCACEDAQHAAPNGLCAHRLAVGLYRRAGELMLKPVPSAQEVMETEVDTVALEEAKQTIPPQYIQIVHGKPHVRYVGLLAMAHEKGLERIEAGFISVTETLALAWAKATFKDGRVFTEAADATPQNVGQQIRPHFARMALTRGKARCLRDALNIGTAAVEELE